MPNPNTLVTTEGVKAFDTSSSTVDKYVQGLTQGRFEPPATVFCSRELEKGLSDFVVAQTSPLGLGPFPSDEAIRTKARGIIGTQDTPADDQWLLEKFKNMMKEKLGLELALSESQTQASSSASASATQLTANSSGTDLLSMPLDMDITDSQFTDIFGDMEFDFGDMSDLLA